MPDYILDGLFVTVGLAFVWQLMGLLRRTRGPLLRVALHALAGLGTLLTANALGALKGLGVGLNGVTVAVSALLGAPGVSLLWAVKYLL